MGAAAADATSPVTSRPGLSASMSVFIATGSSGRSRSAPKSRGDQVDGVHDGGHSQGSCCRTRGGCSDPIILAARGNLIKWEAQSQTPEHTLRELDAFLKDHERILGPDHPYTLTVRGDIAQYTAESGHLPEAIEKWTELLHDRERVLGPENQSTLATRNNIAVATWRSGDKEKVITLATALLNDQV
jgi:hypothetical protein